MFPFRVLIGEYRPGDGWATFALTVVEANASAARNAVLGHPDAGPRQWRVIELHEVDPFPLAVAS